MCRYLLFNLPLFNVGTNEENSIWHFSVLGTCATVSATTPLRHCRELKKVVHVAVALM